MRVKKTNFPKWKCFPIHRTRTDNLANSHTETHASTPQSIFPEMSFEKKKSNVGEIVWFVRVIWARIVKWVRFL